jgi:hypothetical protein
MIKLMGWPEFPENEGQNFRNLHTALEALRLQDECKIPIDSWRERPPVNVHGCTDAYAKVAV